QLRSLQDTLQNPKQRGVFGEYYLETLLKNAFHPKQYAMQYKFPDGEIVDAVLFMGDKMIPIDSKFSLENYNRLSEEQDSNRRAELEKMFLSDLKNRIEETSKYIRPQNGTTEYAFMFIPAEGIYYDLLVNKVGAVKSNTRDLLEYARNEKKVHIVSPTTFYVTLQALWQGMRAYQIQESTKDILKNVGLLQRHMKAYQEYHGKLGGHLGTVVNAYNRSSKEFRKIDKDILKLTGDSNEVDLAELQAPEQEE
ncbi:MAG: DNA recombination protein RmuC, partial [Candidatus Pacearchaeota archaeon]|nr:DNA recombination protein RmuC [Candidatus Pacearchaeota archaeon]